MQKRRVLINASVSVVGVVVNGLAFLILYRFLFATIGAEDVGVWSVVLAWSSVSHLANLGMSGSALKYVAMYLARGDEERVSHVIQTVILSVGGLAAILLPMLYLGLSALLPSFIKPVTKVPAALSVLPYALLSFWLSIQAGVLQSCLDGFHRMDLRGLFVMGSSIGYLAAAILLVPGYGLIGLAWAQLVQWIVLVACCWVALLRLLPALPLLPVRWNQGVFREMLDYNLKFQATSILQLIFDPVTKALLARFGGVEMTGYFDAANKLALQLRSFVVAAHTALIPAIADLQERDPLRVRSVYIDSFRLIFLFYVISLPLLGVFSPVFSEILIGEYQFSFVVFCALLLFAWFTNLLGNPAYFGNIGSGQLRWNIIDHLATSGINLLLGGLLGYLWGGYGVAVGYGIAILTGSLIVMTAYNREAQVRLRELAGADSLRLAFACIFGSALSLLMIGQLTRSQSIWAGASGAVLIYIAVIALPFWRHSMRRQVQHWITNVLLRRSPGPTPIG